MGRIEIPSTLTPAQAEARKTKITGSRIAAIAGEDPWMSPHDVYLEMVEGQRKEDNVHMVRGRLFEEPIAKLWAWENEAELTKPNDIILSQRHPVLGCNPDFFARRKIGDLVDLSIKSPGKFGHLRYGEDGSPDMPRMNYIQVQWELIPLIELGILNRGLLVAHVDGENREFPIEPNEVIQGYLLELGERFMVDHVLKRVPPQLTGTGQEDLWLAQRYPKASETKNFVPATPEIEGWAAQARAGRIQIAEGTVLKKEADANLKAFIGEGYGVSGQGWQACYFNAPTMSWKKAYEELSKHVDSAIGAEIARKHVGSCRKFKPTFAGVEGDDQ